MMLERPLKLERLNFESIELKQLKTESIQLERPLAHNHNPKYSFLNNQFGSIGMMLEQPLELERLNFESIELKQLKTESIELEQPLAHNHNLKH